MNLSFVMAVFNAEKTLERSMQSLLSQDGPITEFLIVNDGSTDNSREILEHFKSTDPRVRIIDQDNHGLTVSLIRGCQDAKGSWIARQDADDWSEPNRVVSCVEHARSHGCNMIGSWVNYYGPSNEFLRTVQRPESAEMATEELLYNGSGPPAHGCMLFEKASYEKAGGYREEFYFGQDSDLWLRMGLIGKVSYVPQVLYNYTITPQALSGRYSELQRWYGDLGQRCHQARLAGHSETSELAEAAKRTTAFKLEKPVTSKKNEASAMYRIGVQLARRNDPAARKYFRSTLKTNPLHWRALMHLAISALKD